MQQTTQKMGQTIARTALCTVLPWALWGCSPDLALGDVSAQGQALDQTAPAAQATASAPAEESPLSDDASSSPRPDFTLAPQLPAPDVTMRVDVLGNGAVAASGVGDLDGDGFGDFAILGKDGVNGTQFLHLRYGGPRPASAEAAFALEQSGARLLLGPFSEEMLEAIVPAGDVDGDGFADLLVGLGRCVPAQPGEGAYLLYGGPARLSGVLRLDEVAVQLLEPRAPDSSEELPSCWVEMDPHVAALGDLDGDGFDDFVLTAQQQSDAEDPLHADATYLFYGSAQRLPSGSSWLAADARLHFHRGSVPTATGDLNADGHADLILSVFGGVEEASSVFLAGAGQRWQGDVDVTSAGVNLNGLFPFTGSGTFPEPTLNPTVLSPPDLDGDGVAEVVLWDGTGSYLFYGQPGLFAGGTGPTAGIRLDNDAERFTDVWFGGDRDGDGDVELLARFYSDDQLVSDVAFASGSRQRATGSLLFPINAVLQANPGSALHEESRHLERIAIAGDLDGDGAGDLLTTSSMYWIDEASGVYELTEPELHIHYGVPGNAPPPVR